MTQHMRESFLRILANTHGNVSEACRAINVKRQTVYQLRKTSPRFAARWDEIVDAVTDALEREAIRRAMEGTNKPIYQGGKLVGAAKEYSDNLLILLLKARRPEIYRDKAPRMEARIPSGDGEAVFTLDLGEGRELHPDDNGDPV